VTRILLCDPLDPEAVRVLTDSSFEVVEQAGLKGESLHAALAAADGAIVRGATRVTRESLSPGGTLRVVARAGSGVDNIDVEACREQGIAVFNTPGANAASVAEHAWGLLLALCRKIPAATASMAAGRWEKSKLSGHEVRGKTLGVVGLGNVGRRVGRYGLAFGCHVLAYDPLVAVNEALPEAKAAGLDELLAESDIVTLHVPLQAETRGLLDEARLAKMKPGAFLLNCARGGIVDEAALERALTDGRLAGAGLDVFETEPPGDRSLLRLPQVVATPHIGASTAEAQLEAALQAAAAVRDFLLSGRAPGRVV
jgi:D-3-phosphoglycerate dehydrogenase